MRKSWFIAASDDMFLRVYNYNTMEKVKAWEAHMDYIRYVGRGEREREEGISRRGLFLIRYPVKFAIGKKAGSAIFLVVKFSLTPSVPPPSIPSSLPPSLPSFSKQICGGPSHPTLRLVRLRRHDHQAVRLGQELGLHASV